MPPIMDFPQHVPEGTGSAEALSHELLESYCGWFAVQVVTRHEKRVASMLEYKGYEQFVPSRKISNRRRKRQDADAEPLFPGYVFCRWRTGVDGLIVTTPGVIRILGHGGTPIPLPPEEVRSIHLVVNSGLPAEIHDLLHVGAEVMVMDGPLRGVIGSVMRFKNQERLVISVNLLLRSVTVEMSNWQVRPVAAFPRSPGAAGPAIKQVSAAS